MTFGLPANAIAGIKAVFGGHPNVQRVVVFGSRALGTHKPNSDIDLAVQGPVDYSELATILGELDELPLPWRFDVIALALLRDAAVRAHIELHGVVLV